MTDTGAALRLPSAQERHMKEQQYFAMSLEGFIREWAPEDERDRTRFQREVYFLMQRAQSLAQEPLLSAYAALAAAMPMPPTLTRIAP